MYKLTDRIKKEVAEHASSSIYRINAATADCYAFKLIGVNSKVSFYGGWDWSKNLVDKEVEYLYMLKTGEFIKLK